jgi:hypothetical protein
VAAVSSGPSTDSTPQYSNKKSELKEKDKPVRISVGTSTILSDVFHCFSQSIQAVAVIIIQIRT